jgi:hypothetical protein
VILALVSAGTAAAAEYPIDTDHPRLLLPQRRLRLLRREQERESLRWNQFESLVKTGSAFPEPGFSYGLHYITSGDQVTGRKAIDWALAPAASDARQLALVFDWCQPLLSKTETDRLAAKLRTVVNAAVTNPTIANQRDRAFAAIALAGYVGFDASPVLEQVVDQWWEDLAGKLSAGALVLPITDHFALYELMHAVRDNVDADLRERAPKYFFTLPIFHLLSHYPEPWNAADGDYRLPIATPGSPPVVRDAALSRAAALEMVALDVNSQETGFLQGWLIQDAYLMASPLGAPYEFLWANPYQPGLSFHYLPNVFHDAANGRLILRSTWEEDASWFYQAPGARQIFRDGKAQDIAKQPVTAPLEFGAATILPAASGSFAVKADEAHTYYLFGMQPSAAYNMEIEDEELREVSTDSGGVLEISYPVRREAAGRLKLTAIDLAK